MDRPSLGLDFLEGRSDHGASNPPPTQPATLVKTFASVLSASVETQVNLFQLPQPTRRGDVTFVKINEALYQEQVGRLLLRKGSKPMTTEILKKSLQSLWNPSSPWRLVPLGKGYFDIHFNSEMDMRRIWGGGTCTLESGILRLTQWKPDFKPGQELPQTHAQVWIQISGLSQEYWHPQLIMEIAMGVGTPLQLDHHIKERSFGYYARVLVDIDLLGHLPTSIMVEQENHCFLVGIVYERLPPKCTHCGLVGHSIDKCRQISGPKVQQSRHLQINMPVRREYRAKLPNQRSMENSLDSPAQPQPSEVVSDATINVISGVVSQNLVAHSGTNEFFEDPVGITVASDGVEILVAKEIVYDSSGIADASIPAVPRHSEGSPIALVGNEVDLTRCITPSNDIQDAPSPVVQVVNEIFEEAALHHIHQIADIVMNETEVLSVGAVNHEVNTVHDGVGGSPSKSWSTIFSEERAASAIESFPPGYGPLDSRSAVEIDVVARFVNGEDIAGFLPVLTISQKKQLRREQKRIASARSEPYPSRVRQKPKKLQ
ncbi:uncharacterized protein LOC133729264 [Rosa rugosa]|uniref:uncharacterized protein LOC133729264 n=1 Tax=Rosa rugosa TaxID=74645 RepID=UPI002B40C8A6|nr:uncharacterized protein LOC133729264 [Rosa rugosa]